MVVGLALSVLGSTWWFQIQETAEILGSVAASSQTIFPYLNELLPKAVKILCHPPCLHFWSLHKTSVPGLMATSSGSTCNAVHSK